MILVVSMSNRLTHCGIPVVLMTYGDSNLILVNTDSGSGLTQVNGLLPDGNKPLPESMLTYHQHVLCHPHIDNNTRNAQES